MRNPNFLILDEPTNDFDIDTLNKLEDLLYHYKGCLLIVSHDRWFMNKLVDHIFVFNGEGNIKDFYGNYTDYKLAREKELRIEKKIEKLQRQNESSDEPKSPKREKSNKLTFKEKKEFEELGLEIDCLEREKSELVEKMNSGTGTSEELTQWAQRYQEVTCRLDESSMRWLELSEKEA